MSHGTQKQYFEDMKECSGGKFDALIYKSEGIELTHFDKTVFHSRVTELGPDSLGLKTTELNPI